MSTLLQQARRELPLAALPLVLIALGGCGGGNSSEAPDAGAPTASSEPTPGIAGKHVASALKASPRGFDSAEDIAANAVKPEDLAEICQSKASLGYERTFFLFAGFGPVALSDGRYLSPRSMFDAILARC